MQADLEKQYENAELREASYDRIRRVNDAKNGRPENHSGDELSDYGGLSKPLGHGSERLRHREHGDEGQKKLRKRVVSQLEFLMVVATEKFVETREPRVLFAAGEATIFSIPVKARRERSESFRSVRKNAHN
jgi:hypothetical protein